MYYAVVWRGCQLSGIQGHFLDGEISAGNIFTFIHQKAGSNKEQA